MYLGHRAQGNLWKRDILLVNFLYIRGEGAALRVGDDAGFGNYLEKTTSLQLTELLG